MWKYLRGEFSARYPDRTGIRILKDEVRLTNRGGPEGRFMAFLRGFDVVRGAYFLVL